MLKSSFAACVVWVGLTGLGAGPAFAQTYPTKPIRIITSPAGGGNAPAGPNAAAAPPPPPTMVILSNE